jgi:hypothetical protein
MSFYHGKNCNGLVFKFLKIKCPEYSWNIVESGVKHHKS